MGETSQGLSAPSVSNGEAIRVALIEDNRLVREGIATLLEGFPDLRIVAKGGSADASLLKELNPRVVLLDLGLRQGNSLRVVQTVREECPETKVIVMDLLPVHEDIAEFVHAGVSGFIMKDATLEDLVDTIRKVARGIPVLPPQMTNSLFSQIAREAVSSGRPKALDAVRMTTRERDVINLIAEGESNKAIARRLHISPHTVKSHVRNIMEKLTLHTRLQIAAYAHQTEPSEPESE
ncbi:MAG: response regulator transcription factor [Longimicrobiales bacterium]|nr:response regulator transcription factor [Longimicrobiales bacterium]